MPFSPTAALSGTLEGGDVEGNQVVYPIGVPPPQPLPNWSTWTPPAGSADQVAGEIAAHIGAAYRLSAGGPRLVRATSTPPDSDHLVHGHPVYVLQLQHGFQDVSHPSQYLTTTSLWGYTLCGTGPDCTIPGTPSIERGQLVRREGLELALYTFEFDPSVGSVVVVLPPPAADASAFTALYFTRGDLEKQLRKPLALTLPLTVPPLPTDPDKAETGTLDRLTIKHLYGVRITSHGSIGAELVLEADF